MAKRQRKGDGASPVDCSNVMLQEFSANASSYCIIAETQINWSIPGILMVTQSGVWRFCLGFSCIVVVTQAINNMQNSVEKWCFIIVSLWTIQITISYLAINIALDTEC